MGAMLKSANSESVAKAREMLHIIMLFHVRVLLGATTECRGPLVSQSFEERSITQ